MAGVDRAGEPVFGPSVIGGASAMIVRVIEAVVFLALPAVVPVVAVVGLRPVTLFLLPLAGSALPAVAVEFELAAGGSFLTWFIVLGVLSNVVAVWRLWSGTSRIGSRSE